MTGSAARISASGTWLFRRGETTWAGHHRHRRPPRPVGSRRRTV